MNIIIKTYSNLPAFLQPISKKIYKKSGLYINPKKRRRKFFLEMMPKNSICAEIGVQRAFFSVQILKIVRPKKLFLIDPWTFYDPKKNAQERLDEFYQIVKKRMKNKPNVEILKGKSIEILNSFPDNHFDWVYIDGDHSYEAVKADLEISYKKVKTNGLITGDDFMYIKPNEGLDIILAVTEFTKSYPIEPIILGKEQQFILKKLK